jgi:hypothetical protein
VTHTILLARVEVRAAAQAIMVDKLFVGRFMRWAGNKRCFEIGTLCTAVGYFFWGQCYRFKRPNSVLSTMVPYALI